MGKMYKKRSKIIFEAYHQILRTFAIASKFQFFLNLALDGPWKKQLVMTISTSKNSWNDFSFLIIFIFLDRCLKQNQTNYRNWKRFLIWGLQNWRHTVWRMGKIDLRWHTPFQKKHMTNYLDFSYVCEAFGESLSIPPLLSKHWWTRCIFKGDSFEVGFFPRKRFFFSHLILKSWRWSRSLYI